MGAENWPLKTAPQAWYMGAHSPINKVCAKEGMVTHCCDPSTQEAEAGGTWEYPGLYGETLSQEQNENKSIQFSDFYLVCSENHTATVDI